jgi:hypothetical protein
METEIKNLCNSGTQYIFQEETGKEGTPHLQGTIITQQPQALSYMKKINGRAHWEICRNKFASINYCQKGLTRTGKLYSNMDLPDLHGSIGTAQKNFKEKISITEEIEREQIKLKDILLYDFENPHSEINKLLKNLNI